jgi:hypothetical protein
MVWDGTDENACRNGFARRTTDDPLNPNIQYSEVDLPVAWFAEGGRCSRWLGGHFLVSGADFGVGVCLFGGGCACCGGSDADFLDLQLFFAHFQACFFNSSI